MPGLIEYLRGYICRVFPDAQMRQPVLAVKRPVLVFRWEQACFIEAAAMQFDLAAVVFLLTYWRRADLAAQPGRMLRAAPTAQATGDEDGLKREDNEWIERGAMVFAAGQTVAETDAERLIDGFKSDRATGAPSGISNNFLTHGYLSAGLSGLPNPFLAAGYFSGRSSNCGLSFT